MSYETLFWFPVKQAECETCKQLSSITVAANDNALYCCAYTTRLARPPKRPDLSKGSAFHGLLHCRCQCRVKSIQRFRRKGANPLLTALQTTLQTSNFECVLLNLYDNVPTKRSSKRRSSTWTIWKELHNRYSVNICVYWSEPWIKTIYTLPKKTYVQRIEFKCQTWHLVQHSHGRGSCLSET